MCTPSQPAFQRLPTPIPTPTPQTMNKVVFIKEPVTEDSANSLMALTLYLDSVDQKRWGRSPERGGWSRASAAGVYTLLQPRRHSQWHPSKGA